MKKYKQKIDSTQSVSTADGQEVKARLLSAEIDAMADLMDQDVVGVFVLASNQDIPRNLETKVLFANESPENTNNALNKLDLSYSNGTFTNTHDGPNVLFVAYQLRWVGDGAVSGYRAGLIEMGDYDYARYQAGALANTAAHVSGSCIIRLPRNGSFSIKAFHNDAAATVPLTTAASGTKLTIAVM